MNDLEKTLDRLYKLAEFLKSDASKTWSNYGTMVRYYISDGSGRVIDIPINNEAMFICGGAVMSSGNRTQSQALHCATLLSRHTAFNSAYLRWVAPPY